MSVCVYVPGVPDVKLTGLHSEVTVRSVPRCADESVCVPGVPDVKLTGLHSEVTVRSVPRCANESVSVYQVYLM